MMDREGQRKMANYAKQAARNMVMAGDATPDEVVSLGLTTDEDLAPYRSIIGRRAEDVLADQDALSEMPFWLVASLIKVDRATRTYPVTVEERKPETATPSPRVRSAAPGDDDDRLGMSALILRLIAESKDEAALKACRDYVIRNRLFVTG